MTCGLPPFTADGLLPVGDYPMTVGDYPMTLAELRASHLVSGDGLGSQTWDAAWRDQLVSGLEIMVQQLWQINITRIFIDGSFVEDKDHPNGIDGYFECDAHYVLSGQLQNDLNAIDPFKVWAWHPATRRLDPSSGKRQLPMWHQYRVELYPHFPNLTFRHSRPVWE